MTPGGTPITAMASWDRTGVEVVGAYNFARTGKSAWSVLFGGGYTDHDWSFNLNTGGVMSTREVQQSWTDGVVGLSHALPFPDVAPVYGFSPREERINCRLTRCATRTTR